MHKLIEKAVLGNYDLRIAVEKIEELRAQYGIRTAEVLPQFFAYGLSQRVKYSENFPLYSNICPRKLTDLNLYFQGVWELDFWGRLRRAKDAACFDMQAQIEDMRDVYIILLAEVAAAYIDIRALERKIELQENLITLDQAYLGLTQDRFSSGLESDVVPQDSLAQLAQAKNMLIHQRTAVAQTVNALAVLLGENPESFDLAEDASWSLHIPSSDELVGVGLPSDLLRRRPDIRRAERELAAANQQVGIAVSDYFPRFFLLGGFGPKCDKFNELFNSKSIGWGVGPSFFWPVINFGRVKYNVLAKRSVERQAAHAYAQTILNAFKDVENALVQFFNTSEQLAILREKYAAIHRKKELVCSLFDAGLVDRLECISAQKELTEIALSLVDAEQTVSTALVVVYKSLGGGW